MAKEWKGNSQSAQYGLGVKKKNSDSVREQDDFYATDPSALEQLLDGCSYWLQGVFNDCMLNDGEYIWECACGNGNLADKLLHQRFDVWATDLKDRGYGKSGIDFLLQPRMIEDGGKIILTNPPYSLADEFTKHALEILPDGGVYIALLNLAQLAGIKRYEQIYSKGSLREVYVFSRRVECYKNNIKTSGAHMINYAWFIFQKGYNGQPTIYWL